MILHLSQVEQFVGHYNDWRVKRVGFVEKLYGKSFFRDKTILELGCGHGHIGRYLQNRLGAKVTFADGREEHLHTIKEILPSADTILLDQNKPWDLNRKFDVVIHWGVLYHLDDWKSDLESVSKHTNLLFLESEVVDTDDPDYEIKVDKVDGYDQDLGEKTTRTSAAAIESHLVDLEFIYNRFDSPELNAEFHVYDWEVKHTKQWEQGKRRFWIAEKV